MFVKQTTNENAKTKTETRNGVTVEFSAGYASLEDYLSTLEFNLKLMKSWPAKAQAKHAAKITELEQKIPLVRRAVG